MAGGRWRGASTGVDRRAQLYQADRLGDRHGLVRVVNCSVVLCAPSLAVPRLGAAKPCARRPAESGAAGRCAGPAGNGYQRDRTARRRRTLIP
jgi:hypothetical protein